VRLELREVGDELALLTRSGHDPPPSELRPASGASSAWPSDGAGPGATPVGALPMHLADASPSLPVPLASLQPPFVNEAHSPLAPGSVVSLKDLSTELPLDGEYHHPACHSIDVSG
jgi:hypothetical protein